MTYAATISLIARGATAAVLASAAVSKLSADDESVARASLPSWVMSAGAGVEGVTAALLILPRSAPVGAAAALAEMGLFLAFSGRWYAKGKRGSCGCGGILPSQAISKEHLASLSALLLMAGGLFAALLLDPALATHPSAASDGWLLCLPATVITAFSAGRAIRSSKRRRSKLDRAAGLRPIA